MANSITLASLDRILPLPGRDQIEKIEKLLPKRIFCALLGIDQKDGDCGTTYANYIFKASLNGRNLGAKRAYERCATFISGLSIDVANEYINEISVNWGNAIVDKDIFEKRADLCTMLKTDGNYKEISSELRTRLNDALKHCDKELLRQVLSALTILAVTRGDNGQWQSVSNVLLNYLPYVSNLSGNPTKEEEEALSKYKKILSNRDSQNWIDAQLFLNQALNSANKRWRAKVFETLGTFWFEEFLGKNRSVFVSGCKAHLKWFYDQKILSQNMTVERLLANLLKADFGELIRVTALNFFRKAQTCLNDLHDKDAQSQWGAVSDIYLEHLIQLYDEGKSEYLTDFKNAAKMQPVQKSWYGKAWRKIAESCLKKKDEQNFIEYLKLACEHKDDAFAQYLALRALSPLEDDQYKELFVKVKKALPPEWNAHNLAEDLKTSENLRIRGEANWRLYLDSDKQDRNCLRESWRCGFPREAVREWDKDIIAYCEVLEHDTSCDEATCLLNVDKSHFVSRIFSSTCPITFDVLYQFDMKEVFKESFRGGKLIVLLAEDNAEKNVSDFLKLLESLKQNHSMTAITIFIWGEEDLLTPIIDTALQQYFNNDDKDYPLMRVEIVDHMRDAARQLLARHPIFFPIRKKKPNDKKTLHFVAVGDGNLVKELVREASWLMTYHKNLNISTKLTMLTPFGRSLKNEIKAVNAELASIIEEKHVLLPRFIAPEDSEAQTLPEVIEDFVSTGDALYFAVAVSQYNLTNLNLAIKIRESLLRSWLKTSKEVKPPVNTPICYYSPDSDAAFIGARTIVLGEEYGSAQNFANSYNLIPFGSHMRFSFNNLVRNIFSRLSLAVHLNYCGITNDKISLENCLENYKSYARKIYNRQSSLSVSLSLATRIFNYEQLTGKKVFDDNWDITDETAIFTEDNLHNLAERMTIQSDTSEITELCRWEHTRWCKYLSFSEGWLEASLADTIKYIIAGNHRQQLFSAKKHSCLTSWSKLDDLSKKISQLLRENGLDLKEDKNFKKSDKTSIASTKEIMEKTILSKAAFSFLKKLFYF